MRILIYQHIVVMGGAERYLLTLLPELKKRNIEVGFFCTLQKSNRDIVSKFSTHFGNYSIPVHICETNSPFGFKAAHSLAKTIKDNRYTILHTHLMHAEITSALSKLLFQPKCKLVITKHGYLQGFMDKYGLDYTKINKLTPAYWVERLIQLFVHKNFAVSKGVAQFYIQTGICKANKMDVIYHGITENAVNKDSNAIRLSQNQILIIGRLKKFKGHHFLLDAIDKLRAEIVDFKLIILGDGEEKEALEQMVINRQLENWVIFAGFTDNVGGYFKGSDIVTVPSIAEPFGLVVLEAYNFSKPVIGFDVPALNENIIDGKTGLLAKAYNTTDLAQKISRLLQNKPLAAEMGENGYQLLTTTFSLDTAISKTILFYES